jgi:hypothetical protein
MPPPSTAIPTSEPTAIPTGPTLTVEQLMNFTYQTEIVPLASAPLVNGHYQVYNPEMQGDTGIDFMEPFALGDLNGDGIEDAAVRLVVQTSGTTGRFSYLYAIINQNGTPQQAAFVWLGDRIILNSLTIEGGVITADMVVAGPNDGMCCPNTPEIKKFRLEGNQLVEVK